MNFNVETKTSTFDQSAAFNKMRDERDAQRDTTNTQAPSKGGFLGLSGTDVVGLNAKEILNMKQAITTMCDNIKKEIDKIQVDLDSTTAYKGEGIKNALQIYLTNVAAYCSNLTSNLKAFNDKLTDVKNQWDAATSSMGEKISGNAGQFAQGSSYTETLQ